MSFMFYTHKPIYPVVKPDPAVTECVANFNFKDLSVLAVGTFASYGFGWQTGIDNFSEISVVFSLIFQYIFNSARRPFRVSNARFCGVIGFFGALSFGIQSSAQRFMGLEPNESEIAKFGALTEAQLERFNKRARYTNNALIDSSNPLDEPAAPVKRYGKFTPEEVRGFRERAKTVPHVYGEEVAAELNEEEKK